MGAGGGGGGGQGQGQGQDQRSCAGERRARVRQGKREVGHQRVGTLSGEHGIGWVQKGYMDVAFTPEELTLMRAIKQVFDPTGILNPEKIFPDLSKT